MDNVIEKQLEELLNFSLEFNEKIKKIFHHLEKDVPGSSNLEEYLRQTDQEKINRLSSREYQVLQFLCKGLSNNEIAEILKISHKTVSIYKSRLYAKTGVKNLAQLILFSQKNMIFN